MARAGPSTFDDDFDDDDLFGDIKPFALPPHLSNLGARDPGSRSAIGDVGTAGISGVSGIRDAEVVEEMDWEEDERQDKLVPELIRHWTNERLAPDILDQRGELVQSVLERVREQAGLVQRLRGDPEASEDEHAQIILVQTEVERIRFIVRSYMRTRLDKIEKYAHHILENPEIQRRLSTIELNHAQSYATLIDTQFDASVLNALPEDLRREGKDWDPSMMNSKPDKDTPLFVHALQDCGRIRLPDGDSMEVNKGDIHLMQFATIEENLRRGEMELV